MRTKGLLIAAVALLATTAAWAQVKPATPPRIAISEDANRLLFRSSHDNTKINLELENVRASEALKKALEAGNKEYVVEGDLPEEPRVSLKIKNVRLSSALDMLTEAMGVGWIVELVDGKQTYRIGKNVRTVPGAFTFPMVPDVLRERLFTAPDITAFVPNHNGKLQPYLFGITEERSTFTCPHCKGTTTLLRQRQQPKCTKCSRAFQSDWQFCPADGAKRPAAPNQWKFCPHCGKDVKIEKSEGTPGPESAVEQARLGTTTSKF